MMIIKKNVLTASALVFALVSATANAQTPFPIGAAPVTFQGNTYQVFIYPGIGWNAADTAAGGHFFEGAPGHLATITSAQEDVFIDSLRQVALSQIGAAPEFWVGGFQTACTPEPTCGWKWDNDDGDIPGSNGSVPGVYSNWLSGEPNDLGTESNIGVGLGGQFGWNDEGNLGNIGGYIVEYEGSEIDQPAGTVDATTCQGITCNPSGAQEVLLPDSVVFGPNATLTQLVQAVFTDPRVDALGQCVDRRLLDVFLELDPSGDPTFNGSLILPEFLCGSRNFAVIRSDAAGFQVLRDVVRSEQFPENVFPQFYECDSTAGDLQERGVFVWSPDETEVPVPEGRALELTNGCGSSRGATRELSWFVLNLHIDCGIPFGSDDAGVLACFVGLTNDKFANLGIAIQNSKTSLISPKYGKLQSSWSTARAHFRNGNYAKALAQLDTLIERLEAADFDTGSGFNHQGNLLMRAENIRFMIVEKINPTP